MSGNKRELDRAKNKSADKLEIQRAALPLVNLLATYGTGKLMGPLVKKLQGLPSVPSKYIKDDIKDLSKHLSEVDSNFKRYPGVRETDAAMKDLGNLSESMLKETGMKGKVKVNLKDGLGNNYYNPIGKSVNVGTVSPSVALHEIGHAADYKNSLSKVVARKIPHIAAALAVPASFGYGDYIKKKIPGTIDDKVVDFIKAHPYATTLAGYGSSTLYPEAKASYSALKHLKKYRGSAAAKGAFLKELGPAFGTYALGSLPLLAVAGAAKYLSEGIGKKKKSKGIKKKAGFLDNTKAVITSEKFKRGFAAGAALGGLTAGGYVAHRVATPSGKAMSEVDRIMSQRNIDNDPFLAAKHKKKIMSKHNKLEKWVDKHPVAATSAAAAVGSLLVGGFMGFSMKDMDLAKRLKSLKG